MPAILFSICTAVIPSSVPATFRSMSPRKSSSPRMSVRMAYSSPSLIRPTPEAVTADLMGIPASMRAREQPQTEAIDVDPFEDSMSETRRTV